MSELATRLQTLAQAMDVEGMTALLEQWPTRNEEWALHVEMRLHAPSSTEQQRQRLRPLFTEYCAAHPEDVYEEMIRLELASVAEAQAALAREAMLDYSSTFALPRLNEQLAATAARIDKAAATHPHLTEAARTLVERVKQQNLNEQAFRKQQYDEEHTERTKHIVFPRIFPRRTFAESLDEKWFVLLGPAADSDQLAELQPLALQPLSADLQWFYSVFGGLKGEFGDALLVTLFSPEHLLHEHRAKEPYRQLSSLNLLDMARWSWGNDRPELTLAGGLPENVHRISGSYTCIGWITDGNGEELDYIIQLEANRFGLLHWHQDYDFVAPDPSNIRGYGLIELLLKAIALGEDLDEDENYDIGSLAEQLNSWS